VRKEGEGEVGEGGVVGVGRGKGKRRVVGVGWAVWANRSFHMVPFPLVGETLNRNSYRKCLPWGNGER